MRVPSGGDASVYRFDICFHDGSRGVFPVELGGPFDPAPAPDIPGIGRDGCGLQAGGDIGDILGVDQVRGVADDLTE